MRLIHTADADGRVDILVLRYFSCVHGSPNALECRTEFLRRDMRQQQHKFIAAVADECVRCVDARENDIRNVPQHRVARKVAVFVVDLLKVVNVDHRQCLRLSSSSC